MSPLQRHPALQLGLFALASALLLAGLHAATRSTIAEQQSQYNQRLLAQVLPHSEGASKREHAALPYGDQMVWRQYKAGEVSAVALAVTAPGGYSGKIELLIGIDRQHTLTGVRVSAHRETPGLGDDIDVRRGPWIEQFAGLSLRSPTLEQWAVKKDGGQFDQFTGATITPRAVINSIRDTLLLSEEHYDALFDPETAAPGASQ